ncbi:hypothetical protein [Geodermatophilus sp. CPCC 206100]|uniref:hypothetical protein n=1 Tax=Geodermatophilus sp. CPCC 206100 TaxID=3020054 RepID=UPI003B00792E
MSETAQVALAVVCLVVSALAELVALALLLREGRRTSAALRRWRDGDGADAGGRQLADVLLGNQVDRATAVVLLLVGVATGAVGSLLTLAAAS